MARGIRRTLLFHFHRKLKSENSFPLSLMASHQRLNSSNYSTHNRPNYSKSQICFFNILNIISSIPPSQNSTPNKGIAVDLNLNLCYHQAETPLVSESFGTGSSAIQGKTDVGISQLQSFQLDNHGIDHSETKSEEGDNSVEVETVPFTGEEQEISDRNCLDLLVEAAKLVSEKDELRTRQGTGMDDFCSDIDDTSPVVRSKRGRNQALPYRFRDSVVEPLKRLGRSHKKRLLSGS